MGFVSRGHSGSDRIILRVNFSVTCGGCRGNLFWHPCFQKSGKGPGASGRLLAGSVPSCSHSGQLPEPERGTILLNALPASPALPLPWWSLSQVTPHCGPAHLEKRPLPTWPWWEGPGLPQILGPGRWSRGHAEGAAQALSLSTRLPKLLSILLHPTS